MGEQEEDVPTQERDQITSEIQSWAFASKTAKPAVAPRTQEVKKHP